MARRSPSASPSALLRIAGGGHFFTDVVFAGVFMFLLIWAALRPDLSLAGDALPSDAIEERPLAQTGEARCATRCRSAGAAASAARADKPLLSGFGNGLRRPAALPIVRAHFGRPTPPQAQGFSMPAGGKKDVKKVVLAYSGGLDTSIILKWLQTTYGCEVVTFTADLGQGEELEPARAKALTLGIKPQNIFIEDLREEFVRDYVFPMFRANALYEGQYLLGTSIARPLIAKKQIEIAEKVGADAVAHGATGKGNDQVRFELAYYALKPDVKVIAPWREWDFNSREALLAFAEQNQIPIAKDKRGEAPFSTDANLLHTSSEGKVLEDPGERSAGLRLFAHRRSGERAGQAGLCHDRFRARRSGRGRRQETIAGGSC